MNRCPHSCSSSMYYRYSSLQQCGHRLHDDFIELRPGAAAELERALDAQYGFHQCNPITCVNIEADDGHNSDQSTGNNAKSPSSQLQQPILRLTLSPLHTGENNLGEDIEARRVSDADSLLVPVSIPHRQSANKLHPQASLRVSLLEMFGPC